MRLDVIDTFPEQLDLLAAESPEASFYHTTAWLESLALSYPRLRRGCVVANVNGELAGAIPFFRLRYGPLQRLWSLPFGTYGGAIARGDEALRNRLRQRYNELLKNPCILEAGWVDHRNETAVPRGQGMWSQTHVIDISGGYDDVWNRAFSAKRRQRARRAEKLGVSVRRASGEDELRQYYRIYVERVRALGGQRPHPESIFLELYRRGGDHVRLFVALSNSTILGGHFNLYFHDTVIAWYNMTTPEGHSVQAGSLLYAECLRDACRDGYRVYNLGGSLGRESLIHFKESLGGVVLDYPTVCARSLPGRIVAAVLARRSRIR